MAGPQPRFVSVSSHQRTVLDRLVRQHTCPQALALRATIILRAASGERTTVLARALSCSPTTARTWRRRWAGAQAVLAAADADLPTLEHTIGQVLADAPRPGAPDTFTAEQIVQIINLACTPPAASGRPITTWTPREVAAEAVKQGIGMCQVPLNSDLSELWCVAAHHDRHLRRRLADGDPGVKGPLRG